MAKYERPKTKPYRPDELVRQLRRAGAIFKDVPSKNLVDILSQSNQPHSTASSATFTREFGSWNNALQVAGYIPENHPRADVRQLDRIVQYFVSTHQDTFRPIDTRGSHELPSMATIKKFFETAEKAASLARDELIALGRVTDESKRGLLVANGDGRAFEEIVQEYLDDDRRDRLRTIGRDLVVRFLDPDLKDGVDLIPSEHIWTFVLGSDDTVRMAADREQTGAVVTTPRFVVRKEAADGTLRFNGTRYQVPRHTVSSPESLGSHPET